jgi:glutaredoxin 3
MKQILDTTSNEPWGPHGSLLAEIAQATNRFGMAAAAAAFIAFAAFASASASKPASFVKSTVKARDVVIFSKSYCP